MLSFLFDPLMLLQLLGSCFVLASMFLMGNLTLWGPVVSFIAGIPFLYINWYAHLWGILPMTLVLMAVDVRNFVKWWKEGVRW